MVLPTLTDECLNDRGRQRFKRIEFLRPVPFRPVAEADHTDDMVILSERYAKKSREGRMPVRHADAVRMG